MKSNNNKLETQTITGIAHLGIIIAGIVVVGIAGVFLYSQEKWLLRITSPENLERICTAYEGKWLPEFNECESISNRKGLDKDVCEELGGVFRDCASMCRNYPRGDDSEIIICPQVCVRTCKF